MSAELIHAHDALAVLREMGSDTVDAVITDPPYSSGGAFRGDRMSDTTTKYVQTGAAIQRPDFQGDNRDQRSFAWWSVLWMSECLRLVKPGGVIAVFTDWRQLPTTTDAVQAAGWVWRGIVPWDKGQGVRPQMGRRFRAQAEYVVWGSRGPMAQDETAALPGAYTVPVLQADKHHITGKPTALMRRLVRICPAAGVILDPFAGSGTTGVAAVAEGYDFVGIEREPAYVEIARRRLADAMHLATPHGAPGSLFTPETPAAGAA